MLLECYASPPNVGTRGCIPENLRIIDLTNVRIRPDDKDPTERCILFRQNEKMLLIYESYDVLRTRIAMAENGFAFIH